MPSWELFEAQPQAYRDAVLPPEVTARVAVEAGVPMGWDRYVGPEGEIVALDRFGASAPYQVLAEEFGFTAEDVAARAKPAWNRITEQIRRAAAEPALLSCNNDGPALLASLFCSQTRQCASVRV